ncbi:MAG TPA: proton-conducting transporter membrane subunit [Planctomycetota bacterium]|nr:proton-conducting transporter membrane subunit [Planctomycetota bacterium]
MSELLWPILIPAAGGLIVLLVPRWRRLREALALVAAILACVMVAVLFSAPGTSRSVFTWLQVETVTLHFALRADALSRFILLAANVFGALIVVYSISFMKGKGRLREYYAYLLWTLAAGNVVLLADDLLLLVIGWEVASLLLFLLVTIGGEKAREGAGKTFVMLGASDCALLLGIVFLWQIQGGLTLSAFQRVSTSSGFAALTYVLLLVAALTKAGAMPFHSWIPKAAEAAPVSVMAYLPAALDKLLGIYLLARMSLFVFDLSFGLQITLLIIGGFTVVLAAMAAIVQNDVNKLLAYSTVSQVGYMVLGIGTGVPVGILGGLFHMLNHALYKCCLFLCAGAVERRTGTTDMGKLGGLARAMPLTFGGFLIAAMAISGVPPLNGFVSKWLVYQGLLKMGTSLSAMFLVLALFGSALTLASFVKASYSVFLGQRPPELAGVKPAGFLMAMPIVFLAAVCLLFGVVYQVPVRYLVGPAVTESGVGTIDLAGSWNSALAAGLILLSIALGLVIYWLARPIRIRRTTMFVGGEIFPSEDVRVPGTGFYESIRNTGVLKTLYSDAEEGAFDIYVLVGRYGSNVVEVLRSIHNGVLSTYLAFGTLGLLVLLFVLLGI